ncbi:MAG: hypothetical protein ABFC98_05100 [Candidatus Cloacimonas sp.]
MQLSDTIISAADIKQIIKRELVFHPELQLIDIYKLVFQAYLGPAHIISDTDEAAKNILTEMLLHSEPYQPLKQDIGNGKGFFRLSLDCLVLKGDVSDRRIFSEIYRKSFLLAEMMQESVTEDINFINITEKWLAVTPIIKELIDFDLADWKAVNNMAESKQIPRHSNHYRTLYNPKYRVLKYDFYDNIETLLK